MARKIAIVNIADTGALETTTLMLQAVGYDCYRPDPQLLHAIRWEAQCEGCYSVEELVKDWGYDPPFLNALASLDMVDRCDLFVDVKAHVNYPRLVKRWKNLEGKVLWCCLNGGDPLKRTKYNGLEKVQDTSWSNPPCPVLTNNMWYKDQSTICQHCVGREPGTPDAYKMQHPCRLCNGKRSIPAPWAGRAYAYYPLYARLNDRNRSGIDGPPICLVHNVAGWGYGHLVEQFRALGGKCYGGGSAPDGLIPHRKVMELLSSARCMVHLKIGDTVGYAVVEAMASAVPVVCTQHYIDETRLHDLLEPYKTCVTFPDFGRTSFGLVMLAVFERLGDPTENAKVGEAGRDRLRQVMWNPHNKEHLDGWEDFLARNFK